MEKIIYGLRTCMCALFFAAFAGIAGPNLNSMSAVAASVMADNIQSLPFEIPLRMNADSSLLFPNAAFVKNFRYSGGEEILVYQYHSFKTAAKDMENFSSGMKEKITKKESAIAEENNMVISGHKENGISGVFFTLDTHIVGILAKEGLQSRETMIRAGEKMIASYNKYLEGFNTPEKCMGTLVKSIEKTDMNLTMDCFYFEPTLMGSIYKNMLAMYMNAKILAREQTGEKFSPPDVKIETGRIEMTSNSEAKVEITKGAHKLPMSQILPLHRQTDVWLPLRREGRKWMIDVEKTMELQFAYSKERAETQNSRAICMSNLKQLGLALHMYASDNKDKMPDDVRELFPRYLPTGSTFKCPGDNTIEEPKKIVSDTPISYTYVKGLSRNAKNAHRIIILYETSSDNHEEKGRHVLFLGGNVAWYSEASFQQLLTQQDALKQ